MTIHAPPTYTVEELERIARDFLAGQPAALQQPPIDVDVLLERLPGVRLDVRRGLQSRFGVMGMVTRDVSDGSILVYIDEAHADGPPARYRMTVAEELAHILIHRTVIDSVMGDDDFRALQQHRSWYDMERNAKRCAAAILMPARAIIERAKQAYTRLVEVAGFENPGAVMKYMASQLATPFEVSQTAMRIRLTEWPMRIKDRVEAAMRARADELE